MGFSMRINFVDVICDNSLRNFYINGEKKGYEFDIRLSYYRGHFLSTIETFELFVDGEKIDNSEVTFSINNKEFFISQLPDLTSEFWYLLDPAKIRIHHNGGLPTGEHDIKLNLFLRIPYMPTPGENGERDYATMDSCGQKVLTISSLEEE